MRRATRLDAQFAAHPSTAKLSEVLAGQTWKPLRDVTTLLASGHTPYLHDVSRGDVGFVTLECIDPLNFRWEKLRRITRHHYDTEFAGKSVRKGMVVCTIKRRICSSFPFLDDPAEPLAVNQDVALISPTSEVLPGYLAAYLSCAIGQAFADRQKTEQMNPYISVASLGTLPVVLLSRRFQELVSYELVKAQRRAADAGLAQEHAEQTLLEELGLVDWQQPEPLTYTRRAADALAAGRMDAEYFRPKYAALMERIRTAGAVRLGDCLTEPIHRGASPEYVEAGEYLVINSQHVGKTQVELRDNRFTSAAFVDDGNNAKAVVRRHDVLLNSTGYITIGRCQALLEAATAIADNHVAIIRPTGDLDPVYLACLLNAMPGQWQSERGWTGSSGQIELRPDVIADYLIWKAPAAVQCGIRKMVEDAHAARRESAALLARAKRAVEIAIEQDEAAALGFLRDGLAPASLESRQRAEEDTTGGPR
jgi:type I restriction enzyme M protein